MTTEMLIMKAQIADAVRMNGSTCDALYFNQLCRDCLLGFTSIEQVRKEFQRLNPVVGYAYGPKPLREVYGFRNIKIYY